MSEDATVGPAAPAGGGRVCQLCGRSLLGGADFCRSCGARYEEPPTERVADLPPAPQPWALGPLVPGALGHTGRSSSSPPRS